ITILLGFVSISFRALSADYIRLSFRLETVHAEARSSIVSKIANSDRHAETHGIAFESPTVRSNGQWASPHVGGSIFATHSAQRLRPPCTSVPKFWPLTSLYFRKRTRKDLHERLRLTAYCRCCWPTS